MTQHETWLVRHGQTAWSIAHRHTGRTDIPLTADGEREAAALQPRLDRRWGLVLTSPLQRAARTAELAGLKATPEPDLMEWDYGPAEGLTRAELTDQLPGDATWNVWDDVPLGEPLSAVAARCARVLHRVAQIDGDVCLVAHGHVLRVLTAVHLGLPAHTAQHLVLAPAHVSRLGHEHATPALLEWNS